MRGIALLLGSVALWGYTIALINFFMKYINKKYINKLPKDKKTFADKYRLVMRYVVRYHKVAGVVATIALIGHFYLMCNLIGLSIPGLVAGIVMFIVFILGIYGFKINKNMRGYWVKVHRFLAFVLIVLVGFHVIFSKFLLIRI